MNASRENRIADPGPKPRICSPHPPPGKANQGTAKQHVGARGAPRSNNTFQKHHLASSNLSPADQDSVRSPRPHGQARLHRQALQSMVNTSMVIGRSRSRPRCFGAAIDDIYARHGSMFPGASCVGEICERASKRHGCPAKASAPSRGAVGFAVQLLCHQDFLAD